MCIKQKCRGLRPLTAGIIFLVMIFTLSCQRPSSIDKPLAASDDFPLLEMDMETLGQLYEEGTYSVEQVVQLYLDRIALIDQQGPSLQSVIQVNPDALEIARELDEELGQGERRGPLHGMPVLLKDNIDTHDKMPTTAGSRALKNSYPLQDSYVANKLREAGAVILGKANLSEWANFRGQLSSSGWSGLGGQTRNPYVLDRNPCGSSSGSAVAVSANLTMFAVGTETNGSIVCPSQATGIVGIKPTVGLVSRSGVIPISHSLDIAGPMGRSVRDAAMALGGMVGVDPGDAATLESEGKFYQDYTRFLDEDGLEGKRIGFFKAAMGRNYKVDTLMRLAVSYMESRGAEVVDLMQVSAPYTAGHALQVMLYEYKAGLNDYFASLGPDAPIQNLEALIAFNKNDSIGMQHFNQAYLEMAQEKGGLDSPDYLDALEFMHEGARQEGIDKVMAEHRLDAIVAPTGGPAWKTDWVNGDHFQVGSSSPAANAGYPNITVPMGFVDDLPVGISFFGKAWSEPVLLEIAYAFEQGSRHRKAPRFLPNDTEKIAR